MQPSVNHIARLLFCLIIISVTGNTYSIAQTAGSTVEEINLKRALELALNHNPRIANIRLREKASQTSLNPAIDIPPMAIHGAYGHINTPFHHDKALAIVQEIGSLPFLLVSSRKKAKTALAGRMDATMAVYLFMAEVKSVYFQWIFLHKQLDLLQAEKNLYRLMPDSLSPLGTLRFINKKSSAELTYQAALDNFGIATAQLRTLLSVDVDIVPSDEAFDLYMVNKPDGFSFYHGNKLLELEQYKVDLEKLNIAAEKAKLYPGLTLGLFNQTNELHKGSYGFMATLSLPVWYAGQQARMKQAIITHQVAENNLRQKQTETRNEIEKLLIELNKQFRTIVFFNENGWETATQMIDIAEDMCLTGQMSFESYTETVSEGLKMKLRYFETVNNYNQTAITLEIYAY